MIERKIRPGMELIFPLPKFRDYQDSGSFLQPVPTIHCHVLRKGTGKDAVRGLGEGHLADTLLRRQAHRNFSWLPYRPGYTTYTTLGNCDVLSGDFSGCRMLLCTVNGEQRVFHVGTANRNDSDESLRAKRAMYDVLNDPAVTYVTGFSPAANYIPLPNDFGDGRPWVLGLITEVGECFSILLSSTFSSATFKTVVAVQPGRVISRADALAFFDV